MIQYFIRRSSYVFNQVAEVVEIIITLDTSRTPPSVQLSHATPIRHSASMSQTAKSRFETFVLHRDGDAPGVCLLGFAVPLSNYDNMRKLGTSRSWPPDFNSSGSACMSMEFLTLPFLMWTYCGADEWSGAQGQAGSLVDDVFSGFRVSYSP
jgi:hypothetical protein